MKRNQPSSCHYSATTRRSETGASKTANLTDRLKNLEALVSSFAAQDLVAQQQRKGKAKLAINDPAVSATSSQEQGHDTSHKTGEKGLNPESPRMRQTQDGHVSYVDSSHWLSVLEDIREVREHLSPEGSALPENVSRGNAASWEPEVPQVGSVMGLNVSLSIEEILSSLPPRALCDRLLSQYFNSRFQVLGEYC